jgi:L-asparaginase
MARVLILYTGGTLGMTFPTERSALKVPPLSSTLLRERLSSRVPELKEIAETQIDVLMNRDSCQFSPEDWVEIADRIRREQKRFDGFVVLHGTDTMAYTASALSFLLSDLRKPIVITGSQRPLAAIRTDARRNLISAVEVAAGELPPGLPSSVLVLFDRFVFQGNRVRKRSSSQFEAFEAPKHAPLAEIGTSIHWRPGVSEPSSSKKTKAKKPLLGQFHRKIVSLSLTPGMDWRLMDSRWLSRVSGILLEVYPSSTAPTENSAFVEFLKCAKKHHVPVVLITEDHHPARASRLRYESLAQLLDLGCISAFEMTRECAWVKTSLLLGQPKQKSRSKAADHQWFSQQISLDLADEGSQP